ncbi:S-adenosyl-L-methionine-dependent methyltransferase [Fomes fomentarius]|nr:S-adenosyl-L-methionine-dependent methyltransferase [Fomes fomentarius]
MATTLVNSRWFGPEAYSEFGPLRALIDAQKERGWDEAWKGNTTPWDAGKAQPALTGLLKSGAIDLPRTGRALVPGCGRGYDAVAIAAALGLETLGTDISSNAVNAARGYLQTTGDLEAKVKFDVADFFAMEEAAAYDVIYDYTFFVAIPPAKRAEWGQQMAKLVKPGGFLITLIFPILPYKDFGPPFYVRPEHYDEVLGEGWETVLDTVPEVTPETLPDHVGKERLVVRRKL